MKLKLNLKTFVLSSVSSIGKSNLVSFISKLIFILLFSLTVSASISSSFSTIFSTSFFSSSSFCCCCLFEAVDIILLKSFPKIFISLLKFCTNFSPNIFLAPCVFSKYFVIGNSPLLLLVSFEISEISLISVNFF